MFVKPSAKYVKFVAAFVILGFVGFLAYLIIRERFSENTTVTRYEIAKPVKHESHSNPHLLSQRSRNQEAQTTETTETGEFPALSENALTDKSPNAENVEGIDENADVDIHALDTEDSSVPPQLSAEELRRQELLRRRANIHEQLNALSSWEQPVHSADDPQTVRQALALSEELTQIDEELSGRNDDDARLSFRLARAYFDGGVTPDGKLTVTAAAKMAEILEQEGYFDIARRERQIIQNAIKSGDEVIKPEHLEGLQ